MSTKIRPELSDRNPYWLERHRYYELKHFCLQYSFWKKSLSDLENADYHSNIFNDNVCSSNISNPTALAAEKKLFYSQRISMIERAARKAADDLWKYILYGVTKELSYDSLRVNYDIPCCKEKYYELYRRFFFFLSYERQ